MEQLLVLTTHATNVLIFGVSLQINNIAICNLVSCSNAVVSPASSVEVLPETSTRKCRDEVCADTSEANSRSTNRGPQTMT